MSFLFSCGNLSFLFVQFVCAQPSDVFTVSDIQYEKDFNKIFGDSFIQRHDLEGVDLDSRTVEKIKEFWKDVGVQSCYK